MDSDDEKVRALLARAGEQPGPPLGLTATGIARRGRRIRVARWGLSGAGLLLVGAVVAVSLALAAPRQVEPATHPPVVVTTTRLQRPLTTATTTTMATTTTTYTTTTSDTP